MSDRNLLDLLGSDPRFVADPRAHLRDRQAPERTRIFRANSWAEALEKSTRSNPSVILREDGTGLIYGSGGSGIVWVCAESDSLSDRQNEALRDVLVALSTLGAVVAVETPYPTV